MNLVIRAISLNDQQLSQPINACYDHRGGTIGRSDTNTLALPDPERHISRLQAEVAWNGSRYQIKNVGAANPILLNGRAIGPGDSAELSDRDEVVVGGYVLGVRYEGDNEAIRTITQGRAAVDARTVIVGSAGDVRTGPPKAAGPADAQAAMPPAESGDNPFADLLGSSGHGPGQVAAAAQAPVESDPFADLGLGSAAPAAAALTFPSPSQPDPFTMTPGFSPAGSLLPDDFDLFAPPTRSEPALRPAGPVPSPGSPSNLLDELGVRAADAPSSLDDAFGLQPTGNPTSADPLAGFLGGTDDPLAGVGQATGGAPRIPGHELDPLALFGGSGGGDLLPPGAPAGQGSALSDHTPELAGSFAPPRVRAPAPQVPAPPASAASPQVPDLPLDVFEHTAPIARANLDLALPVTLGSRVPPPAPAIVPSPMPPPQAATPPQVPAAAPARQPAPIPSTDAMWEAFCGGLGVRLSGQPGLSPELMQVVGQILRHSIEGTLRLMAVRAAAKQELRAQVTTIQARHNNPLKFSPDVDRALEQLLQPPARGFMAGPQATRDAMDDLLGHAIGTMAGMRAALEGVLDRFGPDQLETKLAARKVLDSLLPMNRKAKLWDLYLQHFDSIRGEAQDDFHALFGKAFVAAYEAQLDRLAQQHRGA